MSGEKRMVRMHVLELHESPIVEGNNYDRFRPAWILDDVSGPPRPSPVDGNGIAGCGDWEGITAGDLVVFPELVTGAGDFEGLRFAGERTDSGIPLLQPGVEAVEFPPEIAEIAERRESTLRALYERPLEAMMADQGGLSLGAIYGGDEVVEQFWASPDILPRTARLNYHEGNSWVIPLVECTWVKTESFTVE